MNTRNENPFGTSECVDNECTNTVPNSSLTNLCTSCSNFTQIFGERPSNVETATVEVVEKGLFVNVSRWDIELTVDGDTEQRGPFYSEDLCRERAREYRAATHVLE